MADSIPAYTVASALIVDDRGRIFVQQRSPGRRLFPGCWDIVGGHVEEGESIEECLAREIAEETGWCLDRILRPVGTYEWSAADGVRQEHTFLVRVAGDLFTPRLEMEKVTCCRWITASEAGILHENRRQEGNLIYAMVCAGFAALAKAKEAG